MKSLHLLSKVLPLALLMSMPITSSGQPDQPMSSIEMDILPGEMPLKAAGMEIPIRTPANVSKETEKRHALALEPEYKKPAAARPMHEYKEIESEMATPGRLAPEHRRPALQAKTLRFVKKLNTKKELHEAIKNQKGSIAIRIHKGVGDDVELGKAAQTNPNVKAYSIDANNPEFFDFIEMFKGRNPQYIFIRKEVGLPADMAQAFHKVMSDLTGMPAALETLTRGRAKKDELKGEYHRLVKEAKNAKELHEALSSHKNVTVKISTPWCGACTMAEEPLAEALKAQEGNVKAVSFNAEKPEFKKFQEIFEAPGYPTFFYIHTYKGPEEASELKKVLRDFTGSTRINREYGFDGAQKEKPARRKYRKTFGWFGNREMPEPSSSKNVSEEEQSFPQRRRLKEEL